MLTGDLSPATMQERVEKYPPPANCEYLTLATVNEEIWDLMFRKTRCVDLAFQGTQEALIQSLSALTNLAGNLAIQQGKTPETRQILVKVIKPPKLKAQHEEERADKARSKSCVHKTMQKGNKTLC